MDKLYNDQNIKKRKRKQKTDNGPQSTTQYNIGL